MLGFAVLALGILAAGSVGVVFEGLYDFGRLPTLPTSPDNALRTHYIAAQEYYWDYVPSGMASSRLNLLIFVRYQQYDRRGVY